MSQVHKSSDGGGGGGGSRDTSKESGQKAPDGKKRARRSRSQDNERELEQDPAYALLLKNIQEEGIHIGEKLGSGSYSVVIKAIIANDKEKPLPVAIKIIHTKLAIFLFFQQLFIECYLKSIVFYTKIEQPHFSDVMEAI